MHHKYHTDALLLEATPRGEADMFMTLYTKELGLIRAQARGVRYQKSKLRFSLQPYMWPYVSLVQGKGVWQITNAQTHGYEGFLPERAQRVFTRIMKLVQRLVVGEEKNEQLFFVLKNTYHTLADRDHSDEALYAIECGTVLRMLSFLGYIGETKTLHFCTQTEHFDEDILRQIGLQKDIVLKEINHALRASQL